MWRARFNRITYQRPVSQPHEAGRKPTGHQVTFRPRPLSFPAQKSTSSPEKQSDRQGRRSRAKRAGDLLLDEFKRGRSRRTPSIVPGNGRRAQSSFHRRRRTRRWSRRCRLSSKIFCSAGRKRFSTTLSAILLVQRLAMLIKIGHSVRIVLNAAPVLVMMAMARHLLALAIITTAWNRAEQARARLFSQQCFLP